MLPFSDPIEERKAQISVRTRQKQAARFVASKKKPCSARNRVDRMEQSRRRVVACRPITIKPTRLLLTSNCTCYCVELVLHLQFLPIDSKLQTADHTTTSIATACGPVLVICCFWPLPPVASRLYRALLLRLLRNCELLATHCELRTANCELRTANCELRTALLSTVRFKHDARGKSHRWSSVIRRSMENSVGEHARTQLREARGFGGLIWRIDVTTRVEPRTAKSAGFRPRIEP